MKKRHLLLTTIFGLVVLAQIGAFLVGSKVWPFMRYAMYAQSYGPPPRYNSHSFIAKLSDGREVTLTPEAMHTTVFVWQEVHLRPLIGREPGKVQVFAGFVERELGSAVTHLVRVTDQYEIHGKDIVHQTFAYAYPLDGSEPIPADPDDPFGDLLTADNNLGVASLE